MMLKIDIKSLVLGIFVGLVVYLAAGAASSGNSPDRYQVSIAASVRDVFYVKIDTQTGEIETWQRPANSIPTKRQ